MSTPELKELLERVRKAEEPDRVLDAEIYVAVRGYRMHEDTNPANGIFAFWDGDVCHNCSSWDDPTASLDTCLSLMGEVLPGWGYAIGEFMLAYRANIGERSRDAMVFSADGASDALALLDCILQALLNQEARKET